MPEKPFEKVYLIYDHLMADIDYKSWADYIVNLSGNNLDKDANILELGAGSCKITHFLIQKFPKTIATDLSSYMLKSAFGNNISKVCCDMTCLPFNGKFDLIFSAFDSVNYLLNKKQLLKLFADVKSVLKNNGLFTFDVSMEKNSIDDIHPVIEEGTFNGYSYIKKSKYFKHSKIHKNVFFISGKNGETVKEVHKQKIYTFETYFDLIERSGLYVSNCFDAFTYEDGSKDSERLQFVVKKKRV